MFVRDAFKAAILFLLAFQLYGVSGKPQFSIRGQIGAAKREPTSTSGYMTNAKRLAMGLPPMPPKRRYEATRITARVPQVSPVPYSGFIRAFKASNSASLGWIRSALHSSGRLMLTTSTSGRLPVSFNYISGSPFEIAIGDAGAFHYVGAAGSTLQSNNNIRNGIVRSNSVPAGSIPQTVGNSSGSGGSETFMWFYNPGTMEFTAQWVNPSGAVIDVYFYYEDSGSDTGLHISANSNLPGGFDRVRLFLT